MAAISTAILAAAAAITAATSTYQAVDANQQRQHAKGAAKAEGTRAENMRADLAARQKQEEEDAARLNDREMAKNRRRGLSTGSSGGRGGTVLTSPLGASGTPEIAQKTLLGA